MEPRVEIFRPPVTHSARSRAAVILKNDRLRRQVGRSPGASGVRGTSLLPVEDAGAWKPARASYEYAAAGCGADPADMFLVAVHPWDIQGATRAGLRTAWLNRAGGSYPGYFQAPEFTFTALTELPAALAAAY